MTKGFGDWLVGSAAPLAGIGKHQLLVKSWGGARNAVNRERQEDDGGEENGDDEYGEGDILPRPRLP
jgi:hypothetical protein